MCTDRVMYSDVVEGNDVLTRFKIVEIQNYFGNLLLPFSVIH